MCVCMHIFMCTHVCICLRQIHHHRHRLYAGTRTCRRPPPPVIKCSTIADTTHVILHYFFLSFHNAGERKIRGAGVDREGAAGGGQRAAGARRAGVGGDMGFGFRSLTRGTAGSSKAFLSIFISSQPPTNTHTHTLFNRCWCTGPTSRTTWRSWCPTGRSCRPTRCSIRGAPSRSTRAWYVKGVGEGNSVYVYVCVYVCGG